MWGILSQFGMVSARGELNRARAALRRVTIEERELGSFTDDQLLRESSSLRYRAKCGDDLDALLPRAFALVRETAGRQLGMRHYDVQILAGTLLSRGCLAEMATGEGKTLAAALPLYLHALSGNGAHLATANDYLANRDAEWMRPIFAALGLSVGVIQSDMLPDQRRAAYACDVTYGTAKEFGFDFLRDRLQGSDHGILNTGFHNHSEHRAAQFVQRDLNYALVDEADSILIDEARIPLIISQFESESSAKLTAVSKWAADIVTRLEQTTDFVPDPETSSYRLTPAGRESIRRFPKPSTLAGIQVSDLYHSVEQAILVHQRFRREQQYVIQDGEVVIVDEFNGRIANGRRWRNGLHQAIEAREGLVISPISSSAAQLTTQELFLRYNCWAGMSGTLLPAAREINSVYHRPTVAVPLNRPCRRNHWPDQVYLTAAEKWMAIVEEISTVSLQGRPVLVGTRSIDKSAHLSQLLDQAGISHQVLNALHIRSEAERIANAGQQGQVTVATNMAGRGTDICLGPGVAELGGLHVIGTELHESPRIDRQLSGRAARQGDPGSYRMFLSLDDDILEAGFGQEQSAKLRTAASKRKDTRGFSSLFRSAQHHVEKRHAGQRRQLIQSALRRQDQLEQLGLDPFLEVEEDASNALT